MNIGGKGKAKGKGSKSSSSSGKGKVKGDGKIKVKVEENLDMKDEAIVSVEVRYVARVPRSELADWKKRFELYAKEQEELYSKVELNGHLSKKVESSFAVAVDGDVKILSKKEK